MNNDYNPRLKENACELRNNSISKAEKFIWKAALSRNQLGVKFKRQRPIDKFIVDFFCASLRLIIEIDGSSHLNTSEYDHYRQNKLEKLGYTFLRFSEGEVMNQFDSVYERLERAVYSLKLEKDSVVK
jgi:very-short-patch-repair endonuclease